MGDIEWGMCGVRDPLGNALKMVKKHIKSAEKSNNQNGWRGIKQSKSHKYHFPIPLVFRIKTIKIPEKSREMDNTALVSLTPSTRLETRCPDETAHAHTHRHQARLAESVLVHTPHTILTQPQGGVAFM